MSVWFTPSSARAALVRLRPAVERMRLTYRRLQRRAPRRVVADGPVDPTYFVLVQQLQASVNEIGRAGAIVRDVGRGALEFPARRAGRRVMLCWRAGERHLEHWCDPGAPRRKRPVDEDGPWEVPAREGGRG